MPSKLAAGWGSTVLFWMCCSSIHSYQKSKFVQKYIQLHSLTSMCGGCPRKWFWKRQSRNYTQMCSSSKGLFTNVPWTSTTSAKLFMWGSFIGVTDGGQSNHEVSFHCRWSNKKRRELFCQSRTHDIQNHEQLLSSTAHNTGNPSSELLVIFSRVCTSIWGF